MNIKNVVGFSLYSAMAIVSVFSLAFSVNALLFLGKVILVGGY